MFFASEFRSFSVANLHRSIPRFLDGLKTSQRKALWGAYNKWTSHGEGMFQKNPKEIKVAQFANFVAENTRYHHGEANMTETVKGMAQDFTGANNLPYFTRDGQFGTRNMGGKDAADARYSKTRPEWWLNYVYRKEDIPLLELVEDEGENIEPVTFLPIIPMILINGSMGIGTGYSTYIPNHNPVDIVKWLKSKIKNENNIKTPSPWYRGFEGKIYIKPRRRKDIKKEEIQNEVSDKESDTDSVGSCDYEDTKTDEDQVFSVITYGNFEITQSGKYIITELPIGRWFNNYYQFLQDLREEGKIADFRNRSTSERPHFEITVKGIESMTFETLRLVKSFGMSNMIVLNNHNIPKRYNQTIEILEDFYTERLPYYIKRKAYQLNKLKQEIYKLQVRYDLVEAIVNDKLIINKRKKDDLFNDMKIMNFPELAFEIIKSFKAIELTEDDMDELKDQINKLQNEYEVLYNKKPSEIWLSELEEFEVAYKKVYN
jgi:DNA topoisomerase-2